MESWINTIPWYGIMTMTGTLLAMLFIYIRWNQRGYSKFHFYIMAPATVIIALFGARWWYLIFNPEAYTEMLDIFRIGSGRAIQGAIFFGGIFILFYTKWAAPHLEFRKVASIVLPHILLAQAVGRWGNFYNQEVYGQIVTPEQIASIPSFIREGMLIVDESGVTGYRSPLFLYESVVNFVGWIVIGFFLWDVKWFKPGTHMSLYAIWYNATRIIMEPMRDNTFIMNIEGVPTTFILAIIFFSLGLLSFFIYQFYYDDWAVFRDFKMDAKKEAITEKTLLFLKLVTMQVSKENYDTLVSVSKRKYNNVVNSIDQEKVNELLRRLEWEKLIY